MNSKLGGIRDTKVFDFTGTKGIGNTGGKMKFGDQYAITIHQYLANLDSKVLGISAGQGDPMSAVSSEVIDYIAEFKRCKIRKFQLKDSKIKVCTLYYLISRKNMRGFSFREIVNSVVKRAQGKKAAQTQREGGRKTTRVKNPMTSYNKFSKLLQDEDFFEKLAECGCWRIKDLPSLGMAVSERPDETNKFVNRLSIKDGNLERKLRIKINSKMKKINEKPEFVSSGQRGKIAVAMYLSIKELEKQTEYEFRYKTQKKICSICHINTSTMRTNLEIFRKLF